MVIGRGVETCVHTGDLDGGNPWWSVESLTSTGRRVAVSEDLDSRSLCTDQFGSVQEWETTTSTPTPVHGPKKDKRRNPSLRPLKSTSCFSQGGGGFYLPSFLSSLLLRPVYG